MHHFLRRSCFLFKLRAWARRILVRNTAHETGAAREGLGGFLVVVVVTVWGCLNAILILRFLLKRVLNVSPTSRRSAALPSPAAHARKTALC